MLAPICPFNYARLYMCIKEDEIRLDSTFQLDIPNGTAIDEAAC